MAENSGISWVDHTFNAIIGCTAVSPACDFCYAETWDKRYGGERWGPKAARTRTSVKNWNLVRKWDRQAAAAGKKAIVFGFSLADVFDNHPSIEQSWRDDFWALVRETPHLAWMLLTKRPQNIARYLPADWGAGYAHVSLGVSVENMREMERRVPILRSIPAASRFLSMEPLLERVILPKDALSSGEIDYVIVGGESGTQARPMHIDWARSVRDQCLAAGTAFHFKQWGEWFPFGEIDATGCQNTVSLGKAPGLWHEWAGETGISVRIGVDAAGRFLDGRTWDDRLPLAA